MRTTRRKISSRALAAAALALALAFALAPARADDVLTPAQLFAKARDAWSARPVAPYLSYTMLGHFTFSHRSSEVHYEVLYRASDGKAFERRFRDEGVELAFGEPSLLPDATFGMAPRPAPQPQPLLTDGTQQLPEIGRVSAVAPPPYEIRDAGSETVDDRPCRHLVLTTRYDPMRYPLRDLWIDVNTYDVPKLSAVTQTAGTVRKLVPYEVTYRAMGPYWMMRSVHVLGHTHVLLFSVTTEGTITFPRIEFPATVADWYFDRASYEAHRDDQIRGAGRSG